MRLLDDILTIGLLCVVVVVGVLLAAFIGSGRTDARATGELNFKAAAEYSASFGGLGVLVMQNGQIVFEDYPGSYGPNSASHIRSATKGFWGPTIALMIQERMISGFDEKVSDILTEWKGTNKEDITIRQVMQLSSGLGNSIEDMTGEDPAAPDLYGYAVNEAPARREPGRRFQYGPVNFYVMGAVMNRVLQQHGGQYRDPLDYLDRKLLSKIGVKYTKWLRDDAGHPHIPNGVSITPRNLALWGQFLLQEGSWNGQQLVRRDLMRELYRPSPTNRDFGLFLWLNEPGGFGTSMRDQAPPGARGGVFYHAGLPDMIVAAGAGKNRLYVIPSRDTVVVRQTRDRNDAFEDNDFLQALFGPGG